jgi:hypothetical protein
MLSDFLKNMMLSKKEILGCVLIAIGIQCIARQAVEDDRDERLWSEAAEAEEKVEEKLKRETEAP